MIASKKKKKGAGNRGWKGEQLYSLPSAPEASAKKQIKREERNERKRNSQDTRVDTTTAKQAGKTLKEQGGEMLRLTSPKLPQQQERSKRLKRGSKAEEMSTQET